MKPYSLAEILKRLNTPLNEEQIWAVASLTARFLLVAESPENFQVTLKSAFISPDGSVNVDLSLPWSEDDKEHYLPDETRMQEDYEVEQVMAFSLGALLFTAADYSLAEDEEPLWSEDLEDFVTNLTEEDDDLRTSLAEAISIAWRHAEAEGIDYQDVLRQLYYSAVGVSTTDASSRRGSVVAQGEEEVENETKPEESNNVHQMLMDEIRQPPSLQDSKIRQLPELEAYRTPHEQLLDEIATSVNHVAAHNFLSEQDLLYGHQTAETIQTEIPPSVPSYLSSTSLLSTTKSSPEFSLKSLASKKGSGDSNGKKTQKLAIAVSDIGSILGGWDPSTQVQMAFDAELNAEKDVSDSKLEKDDQLQKEVPVKIEKSPTSSPEKQSDPINGNPGFLLFWDLSHIESTKYRARLEDLADEDPTKYSQIVAKKLCGLCQKTRLNLFVRGKQCACCTRTVCKHCTTQLLIPPFMFQSRPPNSTNASPKDSPKSGRSRSNTKDSLMSLDKNFAYNDQDQHSSGSLTMQSLRNQLHETIDFHKPVSLCNACKGAMGGVTSSQIQTN